MPPKDLADMSIEARGIDAGFQAFMKIKNVSRKRQVEPFGPALQLPLQFWSRLKLNSFGSGHGSIIGEKSAGAKRDIGQPIQNGKL
ncbi:MAG TPA: hypothetical protein VK797_17015 [Tepidisphaeraceae bacterium]|nr:hypothetical protein [Tepidisphaeraceae bacterium]